MVSGHKHITRFTPGGRRALAKIPQTEARRILIELTRLQHGLDVGDTGHMDIKAMSEQPGWFRLRVGDYRVIYTLEADAEGNLVIYVWVLNAGHRREIYG